MVASGMWHRLLSLAGILSLVACGTYVEPRPGVYLGAGKVEADIKCEYAAPTAMVIKSWACRRSDDMAKQEAVGKESLESVRIPPPPPP